MLNSGGVLSVVSLGSSRVEQRGCIVGCVVGKFPC